MLDVFLMSARQLTGKWRLAVMLVLGAVPVTIAVVTTQSGEIPNATEIDDVLITGMLVSAVLPLVVLAVATASFANEVEDRTLSNLTLTPVERWRIVVPKLLAALAIAAPIPMISGAVSLSILLGATIDTGSAESIVALVIGVFVGVAVYAAVFLWLGLATTRALWFGLLYVFLWEGLFSGFVSGIRYLSIKQYVIGIIHGLSDERYADADNILSAPVAAGMAIAVFAVFTALAIRRLRTMDVP